MVRTKQMARKQHGRGMQRAEFPAKPSKVKTSLAAQIEQKTQNLGKTQHLGWILKAVRLDQGRSNQGKSNQIL